MKTVSLIIRLLIVMAFTSGQWVTAQDQEPCISNMLNYIDRMAEGNITPDKGQAFFMHYVSENVPHEKFRSSVIKQTIKVYISPEQTTLESNDIAVYKDEKDIFTVVHPLKKVIWNPAGPGQELNAGGIQEMAAVQKQLLTSGKIVQCKTIESGQGKFQKLELIPAKMYKDQYHINSMVIMFDLQQEMVEKVVINFKANQDVVTQIITYKEINFNYRDFKPGRVKKQFLDKEGNLSNQYQGYTLVRR